MSIRPIDMQVLLPKSQNVSKLNQTLVNKGETLIQQSYNKDKQLQEKKANQVNNLNTKDNPLIKNNSNGNKKNNSSKKKQQNNSKNNKIKNEKQESDSIYTTGIKIDIKV